MQVTPQLRKINRDLYPLFIDVLKAELEYTLNQYIGDVSRQEVCKYLKRSIDVLEKLYKGKIPLDKDKSVDTPTSSF